MLQESALNVHINRANIVVVCLVYVVGQEVWRSILIILTVITSRNILIPYDIREVLNGKIIRLVLCQLVDQLWRTIDSLQQLEESDFIVEVTTMTSRR